MTRRNRILIAAVCLVLGLGGVLSLKGLVADREGLKTAASRPAQDKPLIGGEFDLVDQNGVPVDQTMLIGKWSLVFFGFTYCPDYCPTTLAELAAVQKRLGDRAKDMQIIFISIDPERDSPGMLKDYLSSDGFPEGVIGLTGTPEQVARAARAYRAFYQKVGEGEAYTMNHSLTVYVMGPDGAFRAPIAYGSGPARAAQLIEDAMKAG
jgi:protein SCO1/2